MVEKVVCEICGGQYSKNGIKVHKAYCNGQPKAKDSNEKKEIANVVDSTHVPESVDSKQGLKFGEVNLNTEYQKKKEEIEPTKPKASDSAFQCGNCGYRSDTRHKHCPECGVSWDS